MSALDKMFTQGGVEEKRVHRHKANSFILSVETCKQLMKIYIPLQHVEVFPDCTSFPLEL